LYLLYCKDETARRNRIGPDEVLYLLMDYIDLNRDMA
jgi:hypothetical protein